MLIDPLATYFIRRWNCQIALTMCQTRKYQKSLKQRQFKRSAFVSHISTFQIFNHLAHLKSINPFSYFSYQVFYKSNLHVSEFNLRGICVDYVWIFFYMTYGLFFSLMVYSIEGDLTLKTTNIESSLMMLLLYKW